MIIGNKAPDFSLFDDNAEKVQLSDFLGKNVILYFYPKDDTPGCTQEAIDFQSCIEELLSFSTIVLGISKDSIQNHINFKKKYNLSFALLSDPSTDIMQKYGVWVAKSMFGKKYMGVERTTFLINTAGYVVNIWKKVNVKGHTKEVLKFLKNIIH